MTDANGSYIRSVDRTGFIRWTTVGLPHGIAVVYYALPVVGANGIVYFALAPSGGGGYLIGVDERSGAVTVDQPLTGLSVGLYATASGLVEVDAGGSVEYLGYNGTVDASYTVPFALENLSAGAGGSVFLAGPDQSSAGCSGTVPFHVAKVTPTGVAWTWTDATAPACSNGMIAATPDGGAVTIEWTGARTAMGYFMSLDNMGSKRWSTSMSPTASGLLFAWPPMVDVNGTVVVPTFGDYSCYSQPSSTCTGLNFSFISQSSGATLLPSILATNEANVAFGGDPWGSFLAIAPGRVYADAAADVSNPTFAADADALAAFDAPGVSEDFQFSLREG